MIKFHIPGIVGPYNLNETLITLMQEHKEYFYDDVKISAVYGAFLPCLWNGGRIQSFNYQTDEQKKEIIKHYNDLDIGVIYTFTNTALDERQYGDYICHNDIKNILDRLDINKIIIADDKLKEYIQNVFSGYDIKFILSTTADKVIDGTMNDLESFEDQYDLIVPCHNINNSKELLSTKNPQKYEILVNPQCDYYCKYEKEHYKTVSMINAEKLPPTEEFHCPYNANGFYDFYTLKNKTGFINKEDLYGKYKEKGFNTFKINGRTGGYGDVTSFYIYYMIKPEYYEHTLKAFEHNIEPEYFNYLKKIVLDEQSSQ